MFSIKNCNSKVGIMVLGLFLSISLAYSVALSDVLKSKEDLLKEFDLTFYKMLDDPSDIKTTMEYARIAVQLEDYEAAIPALERILLFNPDLASVKHELGVMYYKLESFEMARSYLEEAKNSKGVTEDVIRKSDKYLNMIN